MKAVEEIKNNLLKRREIIVSISHHGNPGFVMVSKNLAEHFKVGEDQIAVKAVRGSFGANEFLIEAFIYDSLNDKQKVEPKKKEKKTGGAS